MQKEFLPDFYKGEADYVIAQQEKLLIYAGEKGIPVINVIFKNDESETPQWDESPVLKELKKLKYKNFYKTDRNAFEKKRKI